MMDTRIEPGLTSIFRLISGLEVIAFLIVAASIQFLESGDPGLPLNHYFINLFASLFLFIYLSLPWLMRRLKHAYLPFAIAVATGAPILSNRIFLQLQIARYPTILVTNAWELIPLLFVPLVITAWQYDFFSVILFSLLTGIFDFVLTTALAGSLDLELITILGVIFIRTVSFLAAGFMVTQIMDTQRKQRRSLSEANIKLAEYASTLEALAISRERNRLARELHDTVAHALSGLAVQLEAINTVLPQERPDLMSMLNQALTTTRNGLTETRRALHDLRSKQLEDLGLALALRNLGKSAADRANFQISIDIPTLIQDLPPQTEQIIYRIAQESLENIVRHARAEQVQLQVTDEDGLLTLSICDNGVGFLTRDVSNDTLGLKGMQERAASIHGALVVDSSLESGTTIRFTLER